MAISFDIAAAERTTEARALFASLADGNSEPIALTTLSGVDLCVLGGQNGPVSWEALAKSWNRLKPEERSKIIEDRTRQMIKRGLLIEEVPGQGYDSLAHYAVSTRLGIALTARSNPTFIIATSFSPKQAPLILFAVGDVTAPVRGIVMEVPSLIPGKEKETLDWGPLSWQFNYLLVPLDFAAEYLAEWTLRNAPANAVRKKTARTVALFGPGAGREPTAELSVLGNGTAAHVTGARINGDFDKSAIKRIMLQLFDQGTLPT
jgi:hypothetical protein